MGKTRLMLSTLLAFILATTTLFSQDSISISSNSAGLVEYNIQTLVNKTHVFTFLGDGTYSILQQPKHRFAADTAGYTTETYFVKPYKPILPPKKSVQTGNVGSGSNFSNPTVKIPGSIALTTSWATAEEYENFFIISFTNKDTGSVDGCIELHYNSGDINVDTSKIRVYNNWVYNRSHASGTYGNSNQKISWDFSGLAPNEIRHVYVPASVKTKVGNKLELATKYKVNCQGSGTGSATTFLSRRYPHDPNFKIVNKECLDQSPYTAPQNLIYTVGFYNDGNDFAESVFTTDKLPADLDPATFQIIDYEHAPRVTQRGPNGSKIDIDFLEIFLPGTDQTIPQAFTYEDAFTYFKFSICTMSPIRNSCITNEISITFDAQATFIAGPSEICKTEVCSYDPCRNYREDVSSPEQTTQLTTLKKHYHLKYIQIHLPIR